DEHVAELEGRRHRPAVDGDETVARDERHQHGRDQHERDEGDERAAHDRHRRRHASLAVSTRSTSIVCPCAVSSTWEGSVTITVTTTPSPAASVTGPGALSNSTSVSSSAASEPLPAPATPESSTLPANRLLTTAVIAVTRSPGSRLETGVTS